MQDRSQQVESERNTVFPEQGNGHVAVEPANSGRLPFLSISPKWQLILIGGVFIAINILVMVLFVVALVLRR